MRKLKLGSVSEPLLLISHPMIAPLRPSLEQAGMSVALAWEIADADRPRVRAIIHAGEFVLTPEFLGGFPSLGLIALVTAGYEGVDVPWCRARGIEVTHAAGINADDVADHAMGLLLASWRDLADADRMVKAGLWRIEDRLAPQPTLTGRRLGIVGLGHIGRAVARRAEAFDMQVSWWGPNPKPTPWPFAGSLLDLAHACDILVVACRGGEDTKGIVSREVIDAVGPSGMIINVSRGSVVDEDALIEALKAGRLWRAGLDVFATEPTPAARWADVPGVLLSPHRAGATTEGVPRLIAQAVENVKRFLDGQPVMSPVSG